MMRNRILLKTAVSMLLSITIFTCSSTKGFAWGCASLPMGWYLEVNGGSSNLNNVNYPGSVSSSGIGANADLGYKFMPYLGLELGYTQLANTSIKGPPNSTTAGSVKHYSIDIAGRAIVPIAASGLEFFAKLGVVKINSNVSVKNTTVANSIGLGRGNHTRVGPYMALGAQYYFTPEFAANVQWARSQGNSNTGNLDLYSIGVSLIFG